MPALAVAEALRERGAEVSFIGVRGTSAAGTTALAVHMRTATLTVKGRIEGEP